jgi:hypothetical protein
VPGGSRTTAVLRRSCSKISMALSFSTISAHPQNQMRFARVRGFKMTCMSEDDYRPKLKTRPKHPCLPRPTSSISLLKQETVEGVKLDLPPRPPSRMSLAMTFIRYFVCIIAGALISSLLGGLFACLVSLVSPEFVKGLFSPPAGASLSRFAAAVGMIWGIFLGTAVMGFSLLLVTAIQIARVLKRKADEKQDAQELKSGNPN